MRTQTLNSPRAAFWCLGGALLLIWSVGILGRGYWTPDEPREADIAWRMSWQGDKAVPLLAGQPFCEKPPFTYWLAGASISAFGPAAWAARLPNLLYAVLAALAMAVLGKRSMNAIAGAAAAAALGTFLLSYQVAIWLATDAPLLAAVACALCGAYIGFYAADSRERWRGYTLMHTALAFGFLSKSAAAWVVPVLALLALIAWERRWRELLRQELHGGLVIQVAVIGVWVWFVHQAPDGDADLRVFFWNNLAGRFTHVDAPPELQYAGAHQNFPGKYLTELPLYLWPWTLLVIAALRRAWTDRRQPSALLRPVRFALAVFFPALALLSVAATARNVYVAPALPGIALLLGWWVASIVQRVDAWDLRALRATAALLLLAVAVVGVTAVVIGRVSSIARTHSRLDIILAGCGLLGSAVLAYGALRSLREARIQRSLSLLLTSYCVLLSTPALLIYRYVDTWQDLASIGRSIAQDATDRPITLFAPDETTRAFIDMYASTSVVTILGPVDAASVGKLNDRLLGEPRSVVVIQMQRPGDRSAEVPLPMWASAANLQAARRYVLPNGRSYALLDKN